MATWRMSHKRRIFYIRKHSDSLPQHDVFETFRCPKCVWYRLNYEDQPINLYALLAPVRMPVWPLGACATKGGFFIYAKIVTISRNTMFLRLFGVQSEIGRASSR